jgi:hypothetical protein
VLPRREALDQLSATDREIVAILSEHRVVTTQQVQTLLGVPERTVRYRLDRLWRLGLCGGRQPYAEKGSAPYHWWPSRLADAFHRGRELPRGGEREDPREEFLRHAAAITGLYVALNRLAPSLGWRLLSFSREVEAREEFTREEHHSAVVPDAAIVLAEGESEFHALVEVDRGTMSLPRLGRKLRAYIGWAGSRAWEGRHPFLPPVLFLTTSERRVEQIIAKADELCRAAARRAYELGEAKLLEGFVIAASTHVDRPETAISDPVWTERGGAGGLTLRHLVRQVWEQWQEAEEKARLRADEARARVAAILADQEGLRRAVQGRTAGSWRGVHTYSSHLEELEDEDRVVLQTLLEETEPMGDSERRAYRFFQRRTELDSWGAPESARERLPISEQERHAIEELRRLYLKRQRNAVASLYARYPYLPWLLQAMRRLDESTLLEPSAWKNRNERTKTQLKTLKRLHGRMLDYLKERDVEIRGRRRNSGPLQRLTSARSSRLARTIDEDRLLVCPSCEQLFVRQEDPGLGAAPACPFCLDREDLLSINEAEAAGLIESNGEGYWRVCHGPVPRWALEARPAEVGDEVEEER